MKTIMCIAVVVALAAFAAADPVMYEESVHAQAFDFGDELLEAGAAHAPRGSPDSELSKKLALEKKMEDRVKRLEKKEKAINVEENKPHLLPGQKKHKAAIKKAVKTARKHAGAARRAARAERKWARVTRALRKKARKLNRSARKAARSMARSVRASQRKFAAATARNLRLMRRTDALQVKSEKKAARFQKRMAYVQKSMMKGNAAAKASAARRLRKYKLQQARIQGQIWKAHVARRKIVRAMKRDARKLARQKAHVDKVYKSRMARLAAKNAKNQAAFNAKQAASQKFFANAFKSNAAKAAAVQAALRNAERRNKRQAKALSRSIARRAAKEVASKKKADAKYAAQQAAAARALRTKRARTAERFAKKAAAAKRAFKAQMKEAAIKKAKAANAARREKAAKAASERDTKAQEKETKASTAEDMAIKECALDGSECQMPNGQCRKTSPKGPFMGEDMVSCADKKPSEDMDSGLSWAGIPPPLPLPALPKPSPKCLALKKKCQSSGCKAGLAGNPSKDMVTLGCTGKKADLMTYFDMAAACPPICKKGTATSDGRKQDTHGDCIDGDTMAMFKMQITSMPTYKAMGTNGRFSAQLGAGSVCTMVKNLAAGLGF